MSENRAGGAKIASNLGSIDNNGSSHGADRGYDDPVRPFVPGAMRR